MVLRRLKKISDPERALIVEELKNLLNNHEEVIFALLYGSMVDPVISERFGDIDIALYINSEKLQVSEYILESQMEAQISRVLSAKGLDFPPIEVLIINKAPTSFLVRLFKSPYIILKENEEVMTDFIDEIGQKSLANYHFRSEALRELVEG
jgi:predicted nucleotidyltransferase